jgi:hypothetical protein
MVLASGPGALLLAAAPAAEELRERAAAILRDGGSQTTLPGEPRALDLPLGWLDVVLRVLFWGTLAALAVLAAVWLARRLRRATAAVALEAGAPAAPVSSPIASAEALAAEGRFAEAIHALLLETLDALSRAARLAPSLTSREIVLGVPLPGRARDALEGLVLAVERSRFGGDAAGPEDYAACLGRFHAFLESYRVSA